MRAWAASSIGFPIVPPILLVQQQYSILRKNKNIEYITSKADKRVKKLREREESEETQDKNLDEKLLWVELIQS